MDRKTVEQHRLSLFGRMVAGVAHEVDNHLSVVLGFAELIQASGGEKQALEGAGKILSAGEKIASIIKKFSYYVRPHEPAFESFSFLSVLSELAVFSRYDLGRGNVTFTMPGRDSECRMRGDGRDFGLALLAVLLNGTEAMAGKGGGVLAVDVLPREGAWHVTIADEGTGISPAIMPRIFEVGFTTKSSPFHSGMGLPVARHILSGMGGDLSVENRSSGGCLATIRVPAV